MSSRWAPNGGGPDLQDLPQALHRFLELFNAREYWESHEVLEGPWREWGSDFYQGLILYASAFVHAQRGNPRGIRAQLEKAERKLARVPAMLPGCRRRRRACPRGSLPRTRRTSSGRGPAFVAGSRRRASPRARHTARARGRARAPAGGKRSYPKNLIGHALRAGLYRILDEQSGV